MTSLDSNGPLRQASLVSGASCPTDGPARRCSRRVNGFALPAWRGLQSKLRRAALLACLLTAALGCQAQSCAWSRIDRLVPLDDAGLWNTDVYRGLVTALTVAQVGGALWEGSQTRFGKTLWQGIDAQIMASVTAAAGKRIFTRVRPSTADDPCLWFQGGANYSFPSREAAVAMALVGPMVLEYGGEDPTAYALLALPLYIGIARVKNQAHWQSDVLAGWAIGGLSSWLAHSLDTPLTIMLLPDGFALGLRMQF
jgi:membrane-associated phospholipid phosphatase